MKFKLLSLLCWFTIAVSAQPPSSVKKLDGSDIPSSSLTIKLQQIVDTAHIMGLSVVIINDGEMIYKNTFGYRNLGEKSRLDDTTEMYAASLTKPVSTYLFMKLVDEGIFNLDTPIIRYLKNPIGSYEKWADLGKEKDFEKVTPRMIMSHSSGLPILRYLYHDKLSLIAVPGTKFYYSNEAMNLLGFAIEEYTGKPLQDLMNDLIFKPLSMSRTAMIWQTAYDQNYALGYDRNGAVTGMSKRTTAKAAGSMTTTATDYAKFVIALMNREGLSNKLFNEMLTPQIKITSKRGFGPARDTLSHENDHINLSWGLGVGLFSSSYGSAFFHAGHDAGWQNYFVAYPDKKIAIILMSNSSNFEHAADKILDQCIGDKDSPLKWLGYYDNNE